MELNKICKVKSIKLSKKIIDNIEVKQKKQKKQILKNIY